MPRFAWELRVPDQPKLFGDQTKGRALGCRVAYGYNHMICQKSQMAQGPKPKRVVD